MAKKLFQRPMSFSLIVAAGVCAVALGGCDTNEEPVPEGTGDPEEVVSIGVALSSPGLASGSEPAETSGVEVSLAQALATELDILEPGAELRWVPINSAEVKVADVGTDELEFVLGQLTENQLTEDLAWVGPYVSVNSAVLVRQSAEATEDSTTTPPPLPTVTSTEELAKAPVCVVANSTAAITELPLDNVTIQQSVHECEVGMRSGRYDAIAADDLQLNGILMDPNRVSTYELISWTEFSNDKTDLPQELLETHEYWIGTDPAQCETLADALRSVLSQGTLDEAFAQWEETLDFEPNISSISEVTTRHCPAGPS